MLLPMKMSDDPWVTMIAAHWKLPPVEQKYAGLLGLFFIYWN